jgi:hypothetical protein
MLPESVLPQLLMFDAQIRVSVSVRMRGFIHQRTFFVFVHAVFGTGSSESVGGRGIPATAGHRPRAAAAARHYYQERPRPPSRSPTCFY